MFNSIRSCFCNEPLIIPSCPFEFFLPVFPTSFLYQLSLPVPIVYPFYCTYLSLPLRQDASHQCICTDNFVKGRLTTNCSHDNNTSHVHRSGNCIHTIRSHINIGYMHTVSAPTSHVGNPTLFFNYLMLHHKHFLNKFI